MSALCHSCTMASARSRTRAVAAACATAAVLLALCAPAGARTLGGQRRARVLAAPTSEELGYEFLYRMMDRYSSGAQLRLVQSFSGGVLEGGTSPTRSPTMTR